MKSIVIFMQIAVESMDNSPSYDYLAEENMRLRDEALGWHAKVIRLEFDIVQLKMENATLKKQVQALTEEKQNVPNSNEMLYHQ